MVTMTRHQLRAARALLVLQQEVLAEKAGVGVVTVRRFENGNVVGEQLVAALQRVIEDEGAVLVEAGATVDGEVVGAGVVLKVEAALSDGFKERRAAIDQTSKKAAEALPPGARDSVGRRSRVPAPSTLLRRKKAEAAKAKRAATKASAAVHGDGGEG